MAHIQDAQQEEHPRWIAITVPLPGFAANQSALVDLPGKLSESEWTYFIAVLTAMKAGVIQSDPDPASIDGPEPEPDR